MNNEYLSLEYLSFNTPDIFTTLFYFFSALAYAAWLRVRLTKSQSLDLVTSFSIFFHLVPIIIFFPFSYSNLNSLPVGTDYYALIDYLSTAYIISWVGIASFILGTAAISANTRPLALFKYIELCVGRTMMSGRFLTCTAALIAGFILTIVLAGAQFGNARDFTFTNSQFAAPLAFNLELATLGLLGAGAFALSKRGIYSYAIFFILLAESLFAGTRYASIYTLFLIFSMESYFSKTLKFRKVIIVGTILTLAGLLLALGRKTQANYEIAGLLAEAFFGNTFSDVRDFAWLLSKWNGDLLLGTTFFSGISLFLPLDLVPIRSEISWGQFSAHISGFDAATHPGLRPGIFGEVYFNFGILGVVIFSFGGGYLLQYLNQMTLKRFKETRSYSTILTGFVLLGFMPYLFWSAGFISVYIRLFVLTGALIIGLIFSKHKAVSDYEINS